MSEERILYLKELSKKAAIYERLASALGMFGVISGWHQIGSFFASFVRSDLEFSFKLIYTYFVILL